MMSPREQDLTYDLRFITGATHLVVGPSGSGKTQRTAEILRLKDQIIEGGEKIRNVVFCYMVWQEEYQRLKDEGVVTRWVNKLPTSEEFKDLTRPFMHSGGSIVVIDDFMAEISRELLTIVIALSRHMKTSTFLLFQSLFPVQKEARQISLNVKYIHAHKNPRENQQIKSLARQVHEGSDWRWIAAAYHDATRMPYSSFLIDVTQSTGRTPFLKFRSHYLPHEFPMRVYNAKGAFYGKLSERGDVI